MTPVSGKTGASIALGFFSLDGHPDIYGSFPTTSEEYYDGISSRVPAITNHHNRQDDALAWWLIGQAQKPNTLYRYQSPNWQKGFDSGVGAIVFNENLDIHTDTYEILSRAAEASSVPLGASVQAPFMTRGEVLRDTNLLGGSIGFSDAEEDHSAQFRSTIQKRLVYWETLIQDLFLFYE